MILTLDFAPEEEARIRERATAAGKDVTTFVREAVLEKAKPSLSEILAPIHAATDQCGVSVEEIDALADRARQESRRERKAAREQNVP